jgi:hypothetical protein
MADGRYLIFYEFESAPGVVSSDRVVQISQITADRSAEEN